MHNLFKNFFSKQKPKQKFEPKSKNYLLLTIEDDGGVYADFLLKNKTDQSAIFLANFLYEINGGKYTSDLINLLTKLSDNTEYSDFIRKTIAYWSVIVTKQTEEINVTMNSDKPIINPSQFYSDNTKP